MLKLEPATIARLRDRLKAAGERPSVFATDLSKIVAGGDVPAEVLARFDALCEAMFLMAAADGKLEESEIDTLRGAIRELSEGGVRSVQIAAMVKGAQERFGKEGLKARLAAVANHLKTDRDSAEATFICAAAIAFADDDIDDTENEVLNDLADALEIDGDRAETLLDELQADGD
ncbi:MAG: TerB family tellurite resistance protein [Polyangiales bacterium]